MQRVVTCAGDGSMALMVQLGTIFPGEKKQVKFLYRIAS